MKGYVVGDEKGYVGKRFGNWNEMWWCQRIVPPLEREWKERVEAKSFSIMGARVQLFYMYLVKKKLVYYFG